MNAVDLYEYDGTIGSQTPQERAQTPNAVDDEIKGEQSTLNDEVNQVIGQLGRFWGGFRKQSATAFETARKEVGQAVSTAQKELGKRLSETTPGSTADDQATTPTGEIPAASPTSNTATTPLAETSSSISIKANQLFSRLQSTLPPNLAENFQKRLHDAQENPAIQQVRATVTSGLTRLQEQTKGMSLAQAEEFVQQRSEALLKDAGEFLKDAVKILPPNENGLDSGTIWDGTDSWMVTATEYGSEGTRGKSKGGSISFAGNRTAALMRRLRTDASVLSLDPSNEPNASVGAMYEKWKGDAISSKGEIKSDAWFEDRKTALAEDDGALSLLYDQIVPSQMVEELFWERYFFRVHQIEQDELRRKALLDETTTAEKEEDFSWEDEEEEKMSCATMRPEPLAGEGSGVGMTPQVTKARIAPTSPRLSEDSYDHLSQTSGIPSRMSPSTSVVGSEPRNATRPHPVKTGHAEDDGDSDWE